MSQSPGFEYLSSEQAVPTLIPPKSYCVNQEASAASSAARSPADRIREVSHASSDCQNRR